MIMGVDTLEEDKIVRGVREGLGSLLSQEICSSLEALSQDIAVGGTVEFRNMDLPSVSPPGVDDLARALFFVVKLYALKNPKYGDSWCRRGGHGIFHNVARKFDRLERAELEGAVFEMDEIVDLAVYSWLQLAWHLSHRTEDFEAWVRRVFTQP